MKNFHDVYGFLNPAECMVLQRYASGKVCLEVGSFFGKSTVAMAAVAKKVYAVDTFQEDPSNMGTQKDEITTLSGFQENIAEYPNIEYFVGYSQDILPTLSFEVDLVFIDGDHSYEAVKDDILLSWPRLKMGGMFALHDYYISGQSPRNEDIARAWAGVGKASKEIFGDDFIEGHEHLLAWFTKKEMFLI